jgi:uncharacterized protein
MRPPAGTTWQERLARALRRARRSAASGVAALCSAASGVAARCGAASGVAALYSAAGLIAALAGPLAQAAPPAAACPPSMQPPSATDVAAFQRNARDRGFLWRFNKPGGSSAYLYGTVHVGRLPWLGTGPKVMAALQSSDVLALEVDISDPRAAASFAAAPSSGQPALPAALAARLSKAVAAACLPTEAAQRVQGMSPAMQAITLTLLNARWAGLEAGLAQELILIGHARTQNKRIAELESAGMQAALIERLAGADTAAFVGHLLDQIESGQARASIDELARVWEQGLLDRLQDYESWCECANTPEERAMLRELIDGRNPAMADRIDARMRAGERLFVAVGALHMIGPRGLPALLRDRGYRVERITF